MVKKLSCGRNDLDNFIESQENLQEILIKGRFLQNERHDRGGQSDPVWTNEHMHLYRKILETYDSDKETVLLSKEGSRRLINNLKEPDRKFSKEELYNEYWLVKESDHDLF